MSVIETPPKDRLAISIGGGKVRHRHCEAGDRAGDEPRRAGLFCPQSVESIFSRAVAIQEWPNSPDLGRHGRWGEADLEKFCWLMRTIRLFVLHHDRRERPRYSAGHTMIIENADVTGFGVVSVARGEWGRFESAGDAYLLVPTGHQLSEIARTPGGAPGVFRFSAGFRSRRWTWNCAGAGNLLGGEQHGHIEAVGFDMYLKDAGGNGAGVEGIEVRRGAFGAQLGLDIRIPAE